MGSSESPCHQAKPDDIFDQFARAPSAAPVMDEADRPESVAGENDLKHDVASGSDIVAPTSHTPASLRRALQELLKFGMLEQSAKPLLYRQIVTELVRVNALLEPLDLLVRLDDVRGLAFVAIPSPYQGDDADDDEWTHPLVRRQRLTLELSLMLAILRREFLQCEQERGVGCVVKVAVEHLLPQIEVYLRSTGSETQDRKRLVNLLDTLRTHGVVSEIDAQENMTIRPIIVQLANPDNLQALLVRLRALAQTAVDETTQDSKEG
ncbi:hypothetical protein SDC9_78811 [bioreactor metagenome]|uniref:DUF4194 domain-containing protein n=1 Tax=bioreactor metagenome TaxID=1076179 RepID=A0A644YV86_9ZZZZ